MPQPIEFPLLDHVSSGIFAITEDGVIKLWNRVLEEWSGLGRQAMLGENLYQHFPELDRSDFAQQMKQLFATGESLLFDPEQQAHIIPCPLQSGRMRHLKVTVSLLEAHRLAVFSLEDFTGQREMVERYRELADKLQQELNHAKRLEEEKQVLLSAIDQALEAVVICNRDLTIKYVNQTFLRQSGWQEEEIEQLKVPDDLFVDTRSNLGHQLRQLFDEGRPWQGRQQSLRKDGSEFPASISIAPIVSGGMINHAVIIQEDITQQNTMDEKLRRSQKQEALITLVGGIAHDFNNLLAGLVGQIYLITREVGDMPKTLDRAKKARDIVEQASDIVRQLLTFARQGEHQASEFPLDSFIKEFHKLAGHSVPDSIRLALDFKPGSYAFRGDAGQLQQTLLNIIQNSVEACSHNAHGEIKIILAPFDAAPSDAMVRRHPVLRHGNFAHIEVRDNGVGIPADVMERIFDPFFTTKQLGSGLGLAIALGCIRSHHGIIDVESTPGSGTSFHIFLPIRMPREVASDEAARNQGPSARILLVDDDPNVLEPTSELLTAMGHEVEQAADGADAVTLFEQDSKRWDIVITDMVMPRMGGMEAARRIRALRGDIPIIFSTGYDQSLVIEKTRSMENCILISKPLNPDDLDRMIAEMIRNSRLA